MFPISILFALITVRIEQQASSASVAHSLVSNAASPNSSPFHRRSSNASAVGQASQATAGPATLNNTWSNPNYLPVPANPLEYCSTVPPIEQASASTPLPVVFVPVSVLRRPDKPRRESALSKQVIFSDGIRPGGDLTETPASASNSVGISANFAFPNKASTTKGGKRFKLPQIIESNPIANSSKKQCLFLHDSNGELPPMLATDNLNEDCTAESIMALVSDPLAEALYFQLSKNLIVRIKRTRLDCCTHQLCWVLTTAGLSSVGQDELILLLETNPQEQAIPRDLFRLVRVVHDYANRGQPFSDLNHILFEDGLFANPDIGGFIFFRPNLHCLQQVHLPVSPFLVALLIQKAEVPWAKIFPLRLLLRMGADSARTFELQILF